MPSSEDGNNIDECNVTLFSQDTMSENKIFVAESLNTAILDTACTRTVVGKNCLKHFKDSVTDNLQTFDSNKPFRFGDGQIIKSFNKVILPAKIGDVKCKIETEVVDADIPLLLSKTSLKKGGNNS